jgi:hypothetical protein
MVGRKTITAHRIGRHETAQKAIEDMRYNLPANMYVAVLHRIAVQGQREKYDARGNLIAIEDVSEKVQVDTAKYLLDKVMPTHAAMRIEAPEDHSTVSAAQHLDQLSTDELRRLVADKQPLLPLKMDEEDDDVLCS